MSLSGRESEVGRRSPFGDDVLEEGVLEIGEREVEESTSPVPPFAPDLSVVEREGVECVRRVLEQLSSDAMENTERAVERGGDDDDGQYSYVDVVGDVETDEGAVSEGFTFAEAFMRANLLSETVLEGVSVHPNCHCVSLHSSSSLAFLSGIIQWPSIFPIS